ncbi:DUF4349 domain-containing protein [Protaetiibacter intestinalis]|uniref:DUF4349 domain-containing protein n=1 Tax=Protaetiibacter intestinalis TaxID=2419774 RepID=A0A387B4E5_9MICO|nr:DUF4349 domain-containing protein [Protaetiibacter intestinalis]AYF97293.1 DUF4349 domain-containing protein [Protaetiibacter intestinalis]
MRHIPRFPAALAALAAAGIALSGCSAASSGADSASDRGGTSEYAPQAVDAGSTADVESTSSQEQALVITGTVTITADDPIAAAERATEIADAAGGRVDARSENAPRDGRAASATLTLRIPADQLEQVRADLKELGSVDESAFDTVGVGDRQRDLDSRITTLRASIARYTAWLADADTTADLLALESAISERQTQLESLEAEQRELADQVAMSTVTLVLRAEALAPPPEGPTNFWEGLVAGWSGFAAFWAAVAVALGVGLPWLVTLGIVITVVVLVARRVGRAAPPTAPPTAS